MKFTMAAADRFITSHRGEVNPRQRLAFHFMAPTGWINDPNGLVYYDGWYHLFYQYNPYDFHPADMHWGHARTRDFISFEDLPVALAPEIENEETGCFSGTALVNPQDPKELILIYTRHFEKQLGDRLMRKERQRIARSRDGIHFTRDSKDCLTAEMLPANASHEDFRDPDLFYENGWFYVFVGSQDLPSQTGQILVFRSRDLTHFSYFFKIGPLPLFGTMAECPDFFRLDGKDVLLFSSTGLKKQGRRFNNVNSSLAAIGKMDLESGSFAIEGFDEIDTGNCFYAPQTLVDDKNRRIMFGWMEMWDKKHFTDTSEDKWTGAFTLPRQLSLKDISLQSYPVAEIDEAFAPVTGYTDSHKLAKHLELSVKATGPFALALIDSTDQSRRLVIGMDGSGVFIDDSATLCPYGRRYSKNTYDRADIMAVIDTSSCELFINHGAENITTRFYLPSREIRLQMTKTFSADQLLIKEFRK